MTQRQHKELCKIFGKELTDKELQEMGFGKVDGKVDYRLNEDIGLYKVETYHDEVRRNKKGD